MGHVTSRDGTRIAFDSPAELARREKLKREGLDCRS
jgi:hypothetical protein